MTKLTESNRTSFTTQDAAGNDRTSAFGLNTTAAPGSGYRIKILEDFYYGPTAATDENYTFTLGIRNTADNTAADTLCLAVVKLMVGCGHMIGHCSSHDTSLKREFRPV